MKEDRKRTVMIALEDVDEAVRLTDVQLAALALVCTQNKRPSAAKNVLNYMTERMMRRRS